jgi:hypothetical protein
MHQVACCGLSCGEVRTKILTLGTIFNFGCRWPMSLCVRC